MKNVTTARCVVCGATFEPVPGLHECTVCGGILDIQYDYPAIAKEFTKEDLAANPDTTMWRYRPLLPVEETTPAPPLQVGGSPLYPAAMLASELGMSGELWVKDDGQNPTGSLKDRASSMAVAKSVEAEAETICCASTGNAASSLAGNAAAAGMKTVIFVPKRAPEGKVAQLRIFGADVTLVDGSYEETFKQSETCIKDNGFYSRNAAINPYLVEGKKTVAFEIAEQLGWNVPDYVAVSVGDGCTIAGVWKGFCDLYSIGFIEELPKLISVQAAGCCPLNTCIETGGTLEPSEENTLADSIAVGVPRNPDKAFAAVTESEGVTVTVTDEEILAAMRLLGRTQGIFAEPAAAAALAGVKKALNDGKVPATASIVTIVTGNGLKDTANGIKATAV